jgi:hypothetical protein
VNLLPDADRVLDIDERATLRATSPLAQAA